jgi:hypothetical protein
VTHQNDCYQQTKTQPLKPFPVITSLSHQHCHLEKLLIMEKGSTL